MAKTSHTLMTIQQEQEVRRSYYVAMEINNAKPVLSVDIYIVDTVSAVPFGLSPSEMLKTCGTGRTSQPPRV